ncbi:MAG: universal stress protein [Bryobacteraceae bacterium]
MPSQATSFQASASGTNSRGDPAAAIVKCAQAEQVDLIMMPTHGYGPYRKFLLGSVTAKVLHDSDLRSLEQRRDQRSKTPCGL